MEALGIGRTDIGRMREQNEDRLYIDNDSGLYIVSDGMGGHAAGEEASRLAVETVVRSIKDDRAKLNRVRHGLEDPNVAIPIAQEAVEVACKTVYDAALANPELAGMGCTLTLFLMLDRRKVRSVLSLAICKSNSIRYSQCSFLRTYHLPICSAFSTPAKSRLSTPERRSPARVNGVHRCSSYSKGN